jgi:phenylalanine-4-hydroxylase
MTKQTSYIAKTPDQNGVISYTDKEHAVWRDLCGQQISSNQKYSANAYLAGLNMLSMSDQFIPQCHDISECLMPLTGWSVAPVPALISFQQFFKTLSEKTFPAASFIRSRADFNYIKEPDIFHEIFGHAPLLTHPSFAYFSEVIGRIGMQVQPADYSWLIRLYWFTIEFGLIKQNGTFKALGSGLNSSPTELVYSVNSSVPERREFNIMDILRTPYRIDIQQPIYYVIDNIEDLFKATDRDLLSDIREAQSLGLFKPTFAPLKETELTA